MQQQVSTYEKYQIIKTLGKGAQATVKLAQDQQTKQIVAIKFFKSLEDREAIQKEFENLKGIDHPNIIKLIDVIPNGTYKKKSGAQEQKMAVVLEYAAGGETFEYISDCGRFDEQTSRTYYAQLINGLEYLHNKGVCHRDLKPENLLFNDEFVLKMCDFGLSAQIYGKNADGYLRSQVGSLTYQCPEIHMNQPYLGENADLFSAAVILFVFCTGNFPFRAAQPGDKHYELLINKKYSTFWRRHLRNLPGKENFFSDAQKEFFQAALSFPPNDRLNISEIKQTVWFNGPMKTHQEILSEFKQRQQIVEQALERERQQKIQQKQQNQQQQNFVFTGTGFRSGNDLSEFAGLSDKFTNLEKERIIKPFISIPGQTNLTRTVKDPEYVLKLLLQNYDKFAMKDKAELSDNSYKVKFVSKDMFDIETQFNVQLFKDEQQDETIVDFQKLEGSSITFFNIVYIIKKLIQDGKLEEDNDDEEEENKKDE